MGSKSINLIIKKVLRVFGLEIKRIQESGPMMTFPNMERFLYFKRLFDRVIDIDGDIVECGIGKGDSLLMLAFLAKEEMRGRKVWGFDSFEGFPVPSKEDNSIRKPKKGEWGETRIYAVQKLFFNSGLDKHFVQSQITLVQGFFDESLPKCRCSSISFLHIDVDLYASYLTVLKYLYPKVARGGNFI